MSLKDKFNAYARATGADPNETIRVGTFGSFDDPFEQLRVSRSFFDRPQVLTEGIDYEVVE